MSTVAVPKKRSIWDGGESPLKVSYGKLMMWFFLLSDAFTFSALLITYGMIRYMHPTFVGRPAEFTFSIEYWPIPERVYEALPFITGHYPLIFVGIMTFILILSSVTMVLAVEAGHRMDQRDVEKWMLWTIVGGIAFLGCQAWEWNHFIHGEGIGTKMVDGSLFTGANLFQNQYGPPAFADLFFFITGFHGFHVFSGVVINIIIFYQVVMGIMAKRGHYEMVEKVGLYWHFVDLVWVFVFTFFYLI